MNHQWEIELNPSRPHVVIRDGEDITDQIDSIQITAASGSPTQVTVTYLADFVVGRVKETDPKENT